MLTTALVALALGPLGPQPPIYCPTTLKEVNSPAITMEYAGAIFATCTRSCDAAFMKDPKGCIAKAIQAKKTVGVFEFDPVTGWKIDAAKAEASTDYKSIRYYFASADEKKTFDAAPGRYITDVKSEAYHCPVMDQDTTSENAASCADYKGVRYFMCCTVCVKMLRANPVKYMSNVKGVKPLSVVILKKG